MTLRNIPIRKRLHELDRTKAATYPTVARTGDSFRRGKYPLIFDDTNTIIFKSDAAISYPTTLQTGSKYLTADLQSDISITRTGTVNPSAVDPWAVRSYQAEQWEPFKENQIVEYDFLSSSFYLTGSRVEDIGLGFASSLGSKTIIRLELPLTGKSTLLATTASSYYYDSKTKKFESVNPFTSQYTVNAVGQQGVNTGNDKTPPQPREEQLFGPFGKYSTFLMNLPYDSDADGNADGYRSPPLNPSSVFFIRPMGESNSVNGFGVTADENGLAKSYLAESGTNPDSNKQIYLSGILNQPFLIEKCVVELPFEAGSGWFNDTTMISAFGSPNGETSKLIYHDAGGPAITFGLLNYSGKGNSKDIILSGTIIPERDDRRGLRINICTSGTSPNLNYLKTIRSPYGFKSFSEPACVVKEPSNSQFSGSVRMLLEPKASTGISSLWTGINFAPTNPTNKTTYLSASFFGSHLMIQNLVGKSKKGGIENLTGRSTLGRVVDIPSFNNVVLANQDLYQSSGTIAGDDFVFYRCEKDQASPYLLMPNDRLVVTLSKYRSAYISASLLGSGPQSNTVGGNTFLSSLWAYQSSSHDVGISSGTLRITLYGSLIREGKEYHDTLNSRLDTEEIHEAVGMEPIVDEFDAFYLDELTGSYLDRYITGSIVTTNAPFTRRRIFSNTELETGRLLNGEVGTSFDKTTASKSFITRTQVAQNVRISQISSQEERYWDSLTPSIPEFVETAGGEIIEYSFGNQFSFGTHRDVVARSFPFEPRFSKIIRTNNDKVKYKVSNDYTSKDLNSNFSLYLSGQIIVADGKVGELNNFLLFTSDNLVTKEDIYKVLFGFGRNNRCYDATKMPAFTDTGSPINNSGIYTTGSYWGSTNFPNFKYNYYDSFLLSRTTLWIGPEIRGWKYGLVNAFPTFTKSIFRRNRYGQMRDMLEQRIDTKFALENSSMQDSPVKIKFVDSAGSVVQPYETYSSNLSVEATSSIPYDDGNVRNRENPISLARTNQTIVVI